MSQIAADIVVIDDPVSSLDTKALNFACSLVRSRLENAGQVIILTHNLQCMNEFRKAWKSKARPSEGKNPTVTFLFIDVAMPRNLDDLLSFSSMMLESEYGLNAPSGKFAANPKKFN
jgi:wobble nucleotide-excising tRNase